jgi:hypothetical protein
MSSEETVKFQKGLRTIWDNEHLTDIQKRQAISELASAFNKTAFINIVEEPEQNLFPTSQKQMLYSLLEFNNMNDGNRLIMTTHSPYLINFLSIAIQGKYLKNEIIKSNKNNVLDELEKKIPQNSLIDSTDVVIYQLNEVDGTINKLANPEGVPSDKNYLNQSIREGNLLFDSLLEIEERL